MRKLQLLIGVVLAVAAGLGVLVVGKLNQPPEYQVVVAADEIPAFSQIDADNVAIDVQSVSATVAEMYILADEWAAMAAEGAVAAIEPLHPGQPLLHEQVASGAQAQGLTRLAAALDDPDRVIVSVPVEQGSVPSLVPGDVIALYFSAGRVQANQLITETVVGEEPEAEVESTASFTETSGWDGRDEAQVVTITTELEMPLAKQIAEGVVYRLNRERRQNPNYGAPGMEHEPRYIEGELRALDVVVDRETAEWVVFALAHGQVQVAVLPAINRPAVEAGTLPVTAGATWSDFEESFFAEREVNDE
ncbi:MAG: hypothetical protein GY719_05330 [bacterium]|nr:hypothetical protein [bacterium]